MPKIVIRARRDGIFLKQPRPNIDYADIPEMINVVAIDKAKRDLRMSIELREVSLHAGISSLGKKFGLEATFGEAATFITDPVATN